MKNIFSFLKGSLLKKKSNQNNQSNQSNQQTLYKPVYRHDVGPSGKECEIYHKNGRQLRTFFIRDFHVCHTPPLTSQYIYWDRYDYALPVHFYTHQSMLEQVGSPQEKYGMLIESESVVPEDYKIFEQNPGLHSDFNLIFTYDEKILNKYANARFWPGSACVALDFFKPDLGHSLIRDDQYSFKTKNISIQSSNKSFTDLHKIRLSLARKFEGGPVDTFGTFNGGSYVYGPESLKSYRYSIAIENDIAPFYFSEKITNCFAMHTVPIYIGATKIDQFFNMDGIIQVRPNEVDKIDKIVLQCNEKDYAQRLPAILDNYERVKSFLNTYDYMFEKFFKDRA